MSEFEEKQIQRNLTPENLAFSLPGAWTQYNLGADKWQYYRHLEMMEDKLLKVFKGETKRLMISCPTQYGKTLLVSKGFASWFLAKKPNTRVVVTSYDTDFAASIGADARDWVEFNGPKVFGVGVDQDQHSKKDWAVVDTVGRKQYVGSMRAIGVGAGLAGKPADLIIVEDVIKTNAQATSKAYIEMLHTWWEDDVEARVTPVTQIIVVQTRRVPNDLIGFLLDKERKGGDQWEKLFLKEIAEKDDPMGRAEGEPLWPELRPLDWCLQKKKNMPPIWWKANRQCNPTPVGGTSIKLSWFRRYMHPPHKEDADQILFSIETASKDSEINDYSVIMVWLVLDDNKYYLVDMLRERMTYPTLERTVDDMMDIWGPHEVFVEDKGNGTVLIQHINEETAYSAFEVQPVGSKKLRMDNEAPAIRAGHVYIPESGSQEWVFDFEDEVGTFPTSVNDDICDCLSQFLKQMREGAANIDMW